MSDYPPGIQHRRRRPQVPFPLPLREAVGYALRAEEAELINFYRRVPYIAEVLFRHGGQFWTIRSEAPSQAQWTQEALDDWLYGDLVDYQLVAKLASINRVEWTVAMSGDLG